MPYVTDDDSKAVGRIAEIEQELQEAKTELDRWLAASSTPTNAAEMTQRERSTKALTDRIQALATALELQRALASLELHAQERKLAKGSPKKMKDFGYRPVTVQFLGGQEMQLTCLSADRWPATGAAVKRRRKRGRDATSAWCCWAFVTTALLRWLARWPSWRRR